MEKNEEYNEELSKETIKQEKLFISKLKHDNKSLAVRVENLELQIKYYNYSEQLNRIMESMAEPGGDNDIDKEAEELIDTKKED